MKKSILIVDSDEILVKMLELIFKSLGYITYSANNDKAAISIIQNEPVNLIIVELQIPEMGGLTVLTWLQGEAEITVPTLVFTGVVKRSVKEQVMKAGATDMLYKPATLDKLVSKVKEMLS